MKNLNTVGTKIKFFIENVFEKNQNEKYEKSIVLQQV